MRADALVRLRRLSIACVLAAPTCVLAGPHVGPGPGPGSGAAASPPAHADGPPAADSAVAGTTVGSGFTYQGELTSAGSPATGSFPMAFSLFDIAGGGTAVAGPLAFPAVVVEDGRFTVTLDFGVDALGAGPRWLEITVDGFVLSPRQAITPAPFAVRTRGIDVSEAGDVGIGVTASGGSSRLRVWNTEGVGAAIEAFSPGGSAVQAISSNVGNPAVFASNQDVEGTALYATSGGGQRVGQLGTPTAAVRGQAFDTANDWAAFFSGRSYLGERAFLGRTEPITTAEHFGVRTPAEGTNFGGMYISTDGDDARPFYGYANGGLAQAWHSFDGVDDTWRLSIGGIARLQVDATSVTGPRGTGLPVVAANVSSSGSVLGSTGSIALDVDTIPGGFIAYRVAVPGVTLSASTAAVAITPLGDFGDGTTTDFFFDTGANEIVIQFRDLLTEVTKFTAFSIVIHPL